MDLATFWSPEKSKSRSNLNIKKSHFNLILFPPPISGGTDWSMIKSSNLLLYPDRFQSNIIEGRGVQFKFLSTRNATGWYLPTRKFWPIDPLFIYSSKILINWFASDALFIHLGNTNRPQIGKCRVCHSTDRELEISNAISLKVALDFSFRVFGCQRTSGAPKRTFGAKTGPFGGIRSAAEVS